MQNHEIVNVRILPGNHDDESAIAISASMALFYENQDRVQVDDSASRIWWRRFGKVALGGTHGDKIKMADLPLLMAVDRPDDWANSTNKRIYTGHIHHDRTREEGGVVVSSMRSPVAKDAYHSFSKYRSGRSVYTDTFSLDGKLTMPLVLNLGSAA